MLCQLKNGKYINSVTVFLIITLLKSTREKIFLSRKYSRTQLMTLQCFATNIYPWFISLFLLLIALVNFLINQQQEQRIWVFSAQTFPCSINFLNTSPRVLAKNKWPCLPLSFMPCSKTTKETPLMQWQKQLIPIIRNFNTFFQIQNGISRPSNAQDSKSFKSKELLLPQKTGFLPSMTQVVQNHKQKRLKALSTNTVDRSNEKRSVMSALALSSSHKQNTSLST